MTQEPLQFDRPRPRDLFGFGTQNYRIYERLLQGPVTNAEIVRDMNIFNSTGRVSDIRLRLKPYCMDIEARRVDGSLFRYDLKG